MIRFIPPAFRRLVLASAFGLAVIMAAAWQPDAIDAAGASTLVIAQASKDAAREAARAAEDAAREAARAAEDAAREAARVGAEAARDARDQRKRSITNGMDVDRQYDSFDQFLDRDPGLAVMILGVVFIVFLTPILIIALIIWYKIRRNRMQNETMIRLAEKGVLPPSEALQALANNRVDAGVNSGLPLADQAQALTRRTAWSDLRKGVLLGTVGFAFVFHGMVEEGSASWFGLVLLFVGIGYVVLWYFEDRQAVAFNAGRASVSPPVRGPGDAQS